MAKSAWVRPMFDAIAPRYDLLNRLISLGMDRGWRRRAVDMALVEQPRVVVDIGAGTGDLAREILGRENTGVRVVALDFAPAMLRIGQERLRGRDLEQRMWPALGDALNTPLADGCADALVSAFVMRNLDSLECAWREFARILRPGGRLAVLEMSAARLPLFRRVFRLYFHRWVPWLGRRVSGHPSAYGWLPRSVDEFPDPAVIADQLRRAGFVDVSVSRMALGTVALHAARRADASHA